MPEQNKVKRDYEVVREGIVDVMRVNANAWPYVPSVENNPAVMSKVVEWLAAAPSTTKVIFSQRRNYTYDYDQVQLLNGVAALYNSISRQKHLYSFSGQCYDLMGNKYVDFQYVIFNLLKSDPFGAYVELKRLLREEKINLKREMIPGYRDCRQEYIGVLSDFVDDLEKLALIDRAKDQLDGYKLGDRELYKNFFRPIISPDFMFTKIMSKPPIDGEILDHYKVGKNTEVTIYKVPGNIKYLYHINPPEFKLTEDKYELLDLAKNVLVRHKPRKEEFIDPSRMRKTFFNIGVDLIQELAQHKGIDITFKEIQELAEILVRYTVGFGMLEILLEDDKVQDINVNSPIGQLPIFLVHQDYEDCFTNVFLDHEDGESWATKFRLLSGRPLDEANPVLDTELSLPRSRARVAIMGSPLNPWGLAYAFRRHRDKPWTLPLFVDNGMVDYIGAGLISFLIDGARTMLVAGTRGSGKTSFLGSMLVELMRKYRVISIEDTLELPIESLRDMGYNIQPMKVRSALGTGVGTEISADEGIRTSLRMGDSALIVGEVRSTEAKALYEAMRIGALANVVAGTIHGDSPYGVFDRVVNDLGVPRTSFKATDIIIICNPVRSADGLHRWRRVVQVTEVRKHWEKDPLREKGFVDLMKYDAVKDSLVPSDALINGDSEILKSIAGNVREWAGDWDAVWDNVMLRADMKKKLVEYSKKSDFKNLLEAKFVVQSNDEFHRISDSVREEVGSLDSKRILYEWEEWLKRKIREVKYD